MKESFLFLVKLLIFFLISLLFFLITQYIPIENIFSSQKSKDILKLWTEIIKIISFLFTLSSGLIGILQLNKIKNKKKYEKFIVGNIIITNTQIKKIKNKGKNISYLFGDDSTLTNFDFSQGNGISFNHIKFILIMIIILIIVIYLNSIL